MSAVDVRRKVIYAVVVSCLIASDCMALLGDWAYNLKYVGLVLLIGASIIYSNGRSISKTRVIFVACAMLVLLLEIPFHMVLGSYARVIAMYFGIGLIVCFVPSLVRSRADILFIGIVSAILIVLFLVVSWRDCLTQWQYYVSIGRPRLKGCFSNPNSLGAISAIALIELFCGEAESKLGTTLKVLSMSVGSIGLFLSGSRTSWLMAGLFLLIYIYQSGTSKIRNKRFGLLLKFALIIILYVSARFLLQQVSDDSAFNLRLNTLMNIRIGSLQSLVGIGYADSSNIKTITDAAGGAVEILWVSMYYRVGLLGIAAYLLMLSSTLVGLRGRYSPYYWAFLVAVFAQSLGESYLSSIMSYPSCFDWVLLASLPAMSIAHQDNNRILEVGLTQPATKRRLILSLMSRQISTYVAYTAK